MGPYTLFVQVPYNNNNSKILISKFGLTMFIVRTEFGLDPK